jgi:vacuolar iron transporter family protein
LRETVKKEELEAEHHPEAIQKRIEDERGHDYLADGILGAVDGSITTFAIVAGAVGGGFSGTVIIVLGLAKLLADAFSMGVSNYLGTRSRHQRIDQARRQEQRHIEHVPGGEREEIRQIFAQKGFEGEVLDEVVRVITQDEGLWVDTMLAEELGLQTRAPSPLRAALATFGAFVVAGLVPLIPFLIGILSTQEAVILSGAITAISFVLVGIIQGISLDRSALRSGIETLLTGGGAALVAYVVGYWLQRAYGA